MYIGTVIAIATVAIDQISKLLVYGSAPQSIIGDFLWFESTFNTGVAFSLFENGTLFFTIFSGIASIVLIYLLFSKNFLITKFQKISIAFVLGGTISNFFDRLFLGGVRDFISLKFLNFAIFNVADMSIVVGLILLCISIFITIFKEEKVETNAEIASENSKTAKKGTEDDWTEFWFNCSRCWRKN